MANRRDNGGYPRTLRAGKTPRKRQGASAHHERRGDKEIFTKHQAMSEFCADQVAAG